MRNLFKVKKRKISIFLLLILNQFLLNAYALNNKKIYAFDSSEYSPLKNNIKNYKFLVTEKNNNENQYFFKSIKELEKFIMGIDSLNNLENFKDKQNQISPQNNNLDKSDKDSNKKEVFSDQDNLNKTEKISPQNNNLDKSDKDSNKKEVFSNQDNLNKKLPIQILKKSKFKNKKEIIKRKMIDKIPLPSKSEISTSEFKVPSRGYVKLRGPKITLNLQKTDTLETLKLIGKLGEYGIVIVEDANLKNQESLNNSKITANFDEVDISDVFNSILYSANLQAVVENNIIFVGKNILNKSIQPKVSKTYRLNQISAASVADYLSTLGANISKVMIVSGTLKGSELRDTYVNKKEFKDELKNSYGIEGGPLFGLIGTTDLRLQTITLIGSEDLIKTAEKYIKALDLRHRQVALTVKIIDVTLTDTDLTQNIFEFKTGETEVLNKFGLGIKTANFSYGAGKNANIPNIFENGLARGEFFNWLEAKITNDKATVLASPTLILGENPNFLSSGAAKVDDSLLSASIGRPYKNEGFIKVGETVVTGFTQTANEGIVTCTASEGTAGITFGAKVEKIDDNGFITFALSPAISSVTKTVEIAGCGIQNTLSVRKLDTGSIRVKNGDTLILTGVLKDEESVSKSKVPILGDMPILGGLFRKNSSQKRKSELIILVTPKILKDQ